LTQSLAFIEEWASDRLMTVLIVEEERHRLAGAKAIRQRHRHAHVFNPGHPAIFDQGK
jgi:hypothetical protein